MGTNHFNTSKENEHIFLSRFPSIPIPNNITLPEFVLQGAEEYAEKVAFVEAATGKQFTYSQVINDIKRFAKSLRSLGLRKGNVVLVVLPNVAEYAIVALGIMAAGGVFSGANPASLASEIKFQVESSGAKLIVTSGSIHGKVIFLGIIFITQNLHFFGLLPEKQYYKN